MTLPPPITIQTLRDRAGVPDGALDAPLMAAFDAAFASVESYLDRALMLGADSVLIDGKPATVNLRRWPIASVDAVSWHDQPAPIGSYWFDALAGQVLFAWPRGCGPLQIDWTGGYSTLPPDLAWAVLQTFDQFWLTDPASGAAQGALTEASPQKFAITGVGSIDYGSSTGGVMGAGSDPWGMIPASAVQVLEGYRNHPRYGGV